MSAYTDACLVEQHGMAVLLPSRIPRLARPK